MYNRGTGTVSCYSNSGSAVVTGSRTFIHRNNGPRTLGTRQPHWAICALCLTFEPCVYEGPSEHSATCRYDPNRDASVFVASDVLLTS